MSAAEKRHMARVAALPCVLCEISGRGQQQAEVHHLRTGVGAGQRQSGMLTIPLCPDCHRGSKGLHGDKSLLHAVKTDELKLLARTIQNLMEQI